eukprot:976658_1
MYAFGYFHIWISIHLLLQVNVIGNVDIDICNIPADTESGHYTYSASNQTQSVVELECNFGYILDPPSNSGSQYKAHAGICSRSDLNTSLVWISNANAPGCIQKVNYCPSLSKSDMIPNQKSWILPS